MMKRPEKINSLDLYSHKQYPKGYNHACDDWERFLPDWKEIVNIIYKKIEGSEIGEMLNGKVDLIPIAKIISKRIGGKGDG